MAGDLLDNRGRGDAEWGWPPIHPEGRKFGLAAVGVSLIVLVILHWQILGWPLLLGSLGVFAFFRDPERVVPQGAPTRLASPFLHGFTAMPVRIETHG